MLWTYFVIAISALRRNAMRSALTILGVVIGVASVIAMVTVGEGSTYKIRDEIASLGSNMLIVSPGQRQRGPGGRSQNAPAFETRDIEALKAEIPDIIHAAPMSASNAQVIYGGANWSAQLYGTENEYFNIRDWGLSSGRMFAEAEQRAGRSVCLIGETVRRELFGDGDPLGADLRLEKKLSCEIVGVLEAKGQNSFGRDQDELVIIPLRTFFRRVSGKTDIDMIFVSLAEGVEKTDGIAQITRLLRERRHVGADDDDNFSIMDPQEIADALSTTTQVMTGLLGAVAAVSLFVGGIGIMNMMLVSVTERTREIGIRLAVGATQKDIAAQFLIESVVLSVVGGILGLAIGLGLSVIFNKLINVPLIVSPTMVLGAFGFSAAIGIVFGFFPARRAAALDPIEALRHE